MSEALEHGAARDWSLVAHNSTDILSRGEDHEKDGARVLITAVKKQSDTPEAAFLKIC
jgi:hypothetical protein